MVRGAGEQDRERELTSAHSYDGEVEQHRHGVPLATPHGVYSPHSQDLPSRGVLVQNLKTPSYKVHPFLIF